MFSASANIEKVFSSIKKKCEKESKDTSSFILSGNYSKIIMSEEETNIILEEVTI